MYTYIALFLYTYIPIFLDTTAVQTGTILAASDRFVIHVQGKGAHGAMPHLGHDPIVSPRFQVMRCI